MSSSLKVKKATNIKLAAAPVKYKSSAGPMKSSKKQPAKAKAQGTKRSDSADGDNDVELVAQLAALLGIFVKANDDDSGDDEFEGDDDGGEESYDDDEDKVEYEDSYSQVKLGAGTEFIDYMRYCYGDTPASRIVVGTEIVHNPVTVAKRPRLVIIDPRLPVKWNAIRAQQQKQLDAVRWEQHSVGLYVTAEGKAAVSTVRMPQDMLGDGSARTLVFDVDKSGRVSGIDRILKAAIAPQSNANSHAAANGAAKDKRGIEVKTVVKGESSAKSKRKSARDDSTADGSDNEANNSGNDGDSEHAERTSNAAGSRTAKDKY